MQNPSSPHSTVNPPHALEVVGMLGESIVSVDHLEPSHRAPSKNTARWMFGTGAIMLAVSAFAFAKGVANAAANKAAFAAFRDTGLPAYEFRPNALPMGYDYLAFGGLLGGLLAIAYGLLRLRAARAKSTYVIGTVSGSDFATAEAPSPDFPLVTERGGELVVNISNGMSARLSKDGAVFPLNDPANSAFTLPSPAVAGAHEVSLPLGGSIKLRAGQASFVVRKVVANAARVDGFFAGFDARASRFLGGSAIAHLAAVALLATVPPSPKSLALDLGTNGSRIMRAEFAGKEKPVDKTKPGSQLGGSGNTGAAGAAAGPAGKAGRPDSSSTSGKRTIKNRAVDKHLARRIAMDNAREAGITGVLRRSNAAFKDVASAKDFASGYDEYDTVGGYDGGDGSEFGSWGNHRQGTGPGADGSGGIYYTGDYKTLPGDGTPGPGGPGNHHGPKLRKHKVTGPTPTPGAPKVIGGLDKSIVRRYVRRKLARIGHCYDRALLSNPSLRGTVAVTFVISSTGAVLSSAGTGMNSAMNSCVAQVVKGISFPRTDGGIVTVAYPFNFTNASR